MNSTYGPEIKFKGLHLLSPWDISIPLPAIFEYLQRGYTQNELKIVELFTTLVSNLNGCVFKALYHCFGVSSEGKHHKIHD